MDIDPRSPRFASLDLDLDLDIDLDLAPSLRICPPQIQPKSKDRSSGCLLRHPWTPPSIQPKTETDQKTKEKPAETGLPGALHVRSISAKRLRSGAGASNCSYAQNSMSPRPFAFADGRGHCNITLLQPQAAEQGHLNYRKTGRKWL